MMHSINFPVDAVLLLGPTGVGKSPLGDMIAARGFLGRHAHHMDFGSELRMIANGNGPSSHYSTSELDFIKGVLDRGLLLENEHFALAGKIITQFLHRSRFSTEDLLILNGIPRHTGQAKDISSFTAIHALVILDCTADTIYQRLRDNTGGDRTGRSDDDFALVSKKIEIFHERTAPLEAYYSTNNSTIYRIMATATSTTEQSFSTLSSFAATNPPVSLVTKPPER